MVQFLSGVQNGEFKPERLLKDIPPLVCNNVFQKLGDKDLYKWWRSVHCPLVFNSLSSWFVAVGDWFTSQHHEWNQSRETALWAGSWRVKPASGCWFENRPVQWLYNRNQPQLWLKLPPCRCCVDLNKPGCWLTVTKLQFSTVTRHFSYHNVSSFLGRLGKII